MSTKPTLQKKLNLASSRNLNVLWRVSMRWTLIMKTSSMLMHLTNLKLSLIMPWKISIIIWDCSIKEITRRFLKSKFKSDIHPELYLFCKHSLKFWLLSRSQDWLYFQNKNQISLNVWRLELFSNVRTSSHSWALTGRFSLGIHHILNKLNLGFLCNFVVIYKVHKSKPLIIQFTFLFVFYL